ncbi:MAG: helix-turn-helix transcriptional regulator [Peptostreptococcaceae bacterium]|nr:helix-turn-helix transcriptional regulator [Peptostreptococcaceae bacterium]
MINYELLEKLIGDGKRKDFADKTGLTKGYVTKILDRKAVNISIKSAAKIAKAYNISLDDLILIDSIN